METQFEICTVAKYRMIVENSRKYGVGPRVPTVIAVWSVIVLTVLGAAVFGFLNQIWRVIVVAAVFELIVFFMPHYITFFGIRALKKRNGGKLPQAVITISDRIICRSGNEELIYEFSDLVDVVSLKYSYKLRFTQRRSLLIDPEAFTQGNLEEFKQFLQKKRPDLKILES